MVNPSDGVVVVSDDYGFVANRVCSREHCWSETYLVRLNALVHPPEIFGQVEVPELGSGVLVHSACWVPPDPGGFFRARVSSRIDPGRTYVARLTPRNPGSYAYSRED